MQRINYSSGAPLEELAGYSRMVKGWQPNSYRWYYCCTAGWLCLRHHSLRAGTFHLYKIHCFSEKSRC